MTLVVEIAGFCVGWTIGHCVVDMCFNCYKNVCQRHSHNGWEEDTI